MKKKVSNRFICFLLLSAFLLIVASFFVNYSECKEVPTIEELQKKPEIHTAMVKKLTKVAQWDASSINFGKKDFEVGDPIFIVECRKEIIDENGYIVPHVLDLKTTKKGLFVHREKGDCYFYIIENNSCRLTGRPVMAFIPEQRAIVIRG